MQFVSTYKSPLGDIILASDGDYLTGLWFSDQKYFDLELMKSYKKQELPVFSKTKEWLDIYFSNEKPNFTPAIKLASTDFRKQVWNILLEIPYGSVVTYGEIAKRIAQSRGVERISAQAVGGAVGHNPISIIVPCHRVIGADGSLTGYAGGIDKKAYLLKLENAIK
ncbi:MAG: methylated-DNA--[protein]-cysteine S-methyltransferase [Clostridium sp.]|nr:methylated-DNA--[protein]-cysteine S-methyltransferase [Clostridium sp.]